MMSATVTCLFEGSPPCSWKSLLGEGSVSLNELSHWSDHQSCNNQWVDLQFSPCSSWGMFLTLFCWIESLINTIHALKTYRMVMSVTYYGVRIGSLKSICVGLICDVIGEGCHSEVCGCVLCGRSEIVMSCICDGCIYLGVVI